MITRTINPWNQVYAGFALYLHIRCPCPGTTDSDRYRFMKPARTYEQLKKEHEEALRQIDKLNMINGAILAAITEKGSLTKDDYNRLYARVLGEWQTKCSAPRN